MTSLLALRFFLTVRLHAPYALAILIVVLITGMYLVTTNPFGGLDDGLGMLLFLQMFLASTGFSERARRGHFDALLTFSRSRTGALVAHWLVSILPGAAAWLVLCGTALVARGVGSWPIVAGPRSAALFIVSALAWASGFAMTRGTAGFLWTAGLFATAILRTDLVTSRSPAAILFCPFVLIRNGPSDLWPVLTAVLLAFVSLVFVWRQARHLDVYLLEQS